MSAKRHATRAHGIDNEPGKRLRAEKLLPSGCDAAWLCELPKVELHVHLDGALDQALLYDLAKRRIDELPEHVTSAVSGQSMPVRAAVRECRCEADFEQLVTCKGKRSLKAMLDCFSIFLPAVRGSWADLEELAYRFCAVQAKQNIVYTEVRYSPHLLTGGDIFSDGQNVDPEPALAAVTRGLRRGCAEHDIIVNQIICCISFQPAWSLACVELAGRLRHDAPCAVVGVDVAAGEVGDSPDGHAAAFRRARELGLNVTLHAGELGGPENVRHAVEDFGATRVGHGYAAAGEPELLLEMVKKGVHFEVCPTSSLETGAWRPDELGREEAPPWARHPVKTMLEAGASVSFNSDDPSVFATSLTDDLLLGLSAMGLTREDMLKVTLTAAEASFASEAEKERVKRFIQKYAADAPHPELAKL